MKVFVNVCLLLIGLFISSSITAQNIGEKLQKAFLQFESDSQLKHAISSLYVIDANSGEVVFDKNSQIGMAPASTQKIITSVTAFELLGKDYRYKTDFGYADLKDGVISGELFIIGRGDPTFGSWRWESTSRKTVIKDFTKALKDQKIKSINAPINYVLKHFSSQDIPDGWIWQDIGNYYGAGAGAINWNENQYDLILKSGKNVGDSVEAVSTDPLVFFQNGMGSEATSAKKGSGDNAYIYLPVNYTGAYVRGTIPIDENSFKISGAMADPHVYFVTELAKSIGEKIEFTREHRPEVKSIQDVMSNPKSKIFYTHLSPTLDSIIYWFNKKSINLYGEALIKTFAYEKQGYGSTDSGVNIVKKFWKEKGLDEDELNIYDGSGLSPLNRVTTHVQVEILKYAKTRDWFLSFFNALPEYNNMHMKSGTISDVKGFCGYHKAADGKEYIFSFLVNNYSGRTSGVVNKMYKVLDVLK